MKNYAAATAAVLRRVLRLRRAGLTEIHSQHPCCLKRAHMLSCLIQMSALRFRALGSMVFSQDGTRAICPTAKALHG